jgi:hypothetical protein
MVTATGTTCPGVYFCTFAVLSESWINEVNNEEYNVTIRKLMEYSNDLTYECTLTEQYVAGFWVVATVGLSNEFLPLGIPSGNY